MNSRELNRALLARQHLLGRCRHPADDLIGELGGLNAQLPDIAHLALLARAEGFAPAELDRLIEERRVVRATWWRGTLHLVRAGDYVRQRRLLDRMLLRVFRGFFPAEARVLDLDRVLDRAAELLSGRALTRQELDVELSALQPAASRRGAAAFCARMLLPLVQVAPSGQWGESGHPRYSLAEEYLGRPLDPSGEGITDLVLGYLAAFGPASVADLQYWSGMTGLARVCQDLGDRLQTIRAEDGRTLLDIPGAATADPWADAPARLLGRYDNVIYGHAVRTRVAPEARRRAISPGAGPAPATFLVDGLVAGTWRVDTRGEEAVLTLSPFDRLPPSQRDELAVEAGRVLAVCAPGSIGRRVEFGPED